MKKFRGVIIVIMILAAGMAGYAYWMNRDTLTPAEKNTAVSDADKLITRDLEKSYPNTPTKVVEFYSDIMLCYYKEDTDDKTIKKLAEQSRNLFDEELLAANPETDFYLATEFAVDAFNENKMWITLYTMSSSQDVKYSTIEGQKYAALSVKYILRNTGGGSAYTYIDYLLRKDSNDRWKILGWQQTDMGE